MKRQRSGTKLPLAVSDLIGRAGVSLEMRGVSNFLPFSFQREWGTEMRFNDLSLGFPSKEVAREERHFQTEKTEAHRKGAMPCQDGRKKESANTSISSEVRGIAELARSAQRRLLRER
jgi:hypothetical protein